ncbi:hypothetical protein Landi51_03394 [Colletotrichum acutatum]
MNKVLLHLYEFLTGAGAGDWEKDKDEEEEEESSTLAGGCGCGCGGAAAAAAIAATAWLYCRFSDAPVRLWSFARGVGPKADVCSLLTGCPGPQEGKLGSRCDDETELEMLDWPSIGFNCRPARTPFSDDPVSRQGVDAFPSVGGIVVAVTAEGVDRREPPQLIRPCQRKATLLFKAARYVKVVYDEETFGLSTRVEEEVGDVRDPRTPGLGDL